MSKQRALDALAGILPDRIPQWDMPDSPALAEQLFGPGIWDDPYATTLKLLEHFDIDLVHYIPGDCAEWNFPLVRYFGEVSYVDDPAVEPYRRAFALPEPVPYRSMYDNLGMQAEAAFWGMSPTMVMKNHPVASPEDVLAFEPLAHDPFTEAERAAFFRDYYARKQRDLGGTAAMMGWYYHTLFMWPVEIFGWENFMIAAMTDEDRFAEILSQFLELTKRDLRAMCSCDDLVLIGCHDDLCTAQGPMFPPAWYERFIFPHYPEIFEIVHQAGKKVLYVCDGNVLPLLDRLAALDIDGIAIDSNSDLAAVMEAFSGRIVAGGTNPAVLLSGSADDIARMVKETAAIVRGEPGYILQNCGMTGKTPPENIRHYQRCVQEFAHH